MELKQDNWATDIKRTYNRVQRDLKSVRWTTVVSSSQEVSVKKISVAAVQTMFVVRGHFLNFSDVDIVLLSGPGGSVEKNCAVCVMIQWRWCCTDGNDASSSPVVWDVFVKETQSEERVEA